MKSERRGVHQLGVWDGVSIIIGIVVGVTIFKAPSLIFSNVAGPWQGMAVWLIGGLLSLIGALCYAELATAYPDSGGDYVYLTEAYGSFVGFFYGWAQLAAILTGSVGAMAYVFADYATAFWKFPSTASVWFAIAAVVGLSVVNILGFSLGKTVQNLLTIAKLIGVMAIVFVGLLWGGHESFSLNKPVSTLSLGTAFVLVLYAYGGWNDAAFVAAEVRDRQRNIPRVLILGTGAVTLIYLLVNAAYLWGLGFEGLRQSETPASALLRTAFGENGSKVMSILVMISALGAVNGVIFTSSRVYARLGTEHPLFTMLGRWHATLNTPVWSILTQSLVALMFIVVVGTPFGQDSVDRLLSGIGLEPVSWQNYGGGFGALVSATAPFFWFFFLLTGLALIVLRRAQPERNRPFRVPLYPFLPLFFCVMTCFMLYSSLAYAKELTLLAGIPLLLGVPLYFVSRRNTSGSKKRNTDLYPRG